MASPPPVKVMGARGQDVARAVTQRAVHHQVHICRADGRDTSAEHH